MPSMRAGGSLSPSPPQTGARPILYRDRRDSEESIATELCDGPLVEEASGVDVQLTPSVPEVDFVLGQDRATLIDRLKQREKALWINARSNLLSQSRQSAADDHGTTSKQDGHEITVENSVNANAAAGFEIQRPRSALHAGDFSKAGSSTSATNSEDLHSSALPIATSPPRPSPFSPADPVVPWPPSRSNVSRRLSAAYIPNDGRQCAGSPKYVLKAPTSPLVRESHDIDTEMGHDSIFGGPRSNRRHTLTPHGSYNQTSSYSNFTAAARGPASLQRENTHPFQNHKQRRSLGGSWALPMSGTSPQTPPFLRSRTSSFSSEASPRQSSMVGSYEESILRGRMSGAPSLPLDFEAGIGALGKAGCKPLMPEHVRIGFPAVFYSWTDGQGRIGSVNQEPSPYVGRIDLTNNLAPPRVRKERKRDKGSAKAYLPTGEEFPTAKDPSKKRRLNLEEAGVRRDADEAEHLLMGGAYRIPKKGTLQLIIKNPNKTAVKVFIVPYDLDGMQPNQRTWVRQRLYSTGPVTEKPISSKPMVESSCNSDSSGWNVNAKPTLRYLIHFKICCPCKGRYYLYDEIRVVFANRVPDNKEKLRSEVQMPDDPKYMSFKPMRPTKRQASSTSPAVVSMEERASRRRSYGVASTKSVQPFAVPSLPRSVSGPETHNFGSRTPPTPVPPMPTDRYYDNNDMSMVDVDTESSSSAYVLSPNRETWNSRLDEFLSSPETSMQNNGGSVTHRHRHENSNNLSDCAQSNAFAKLSRDDARFGGYLGRSGTPEPGEGLIARRLKELDVDNRDRNGEQ